MNKIGTSLLFAAALCAAPLLGAADNGTRTIRLRQDDAQVHFTSKIYELKHADAEEILPFVNSAIRRYSSNSTIRRVTAANAKDGLLVSTGVDMMPYVDKIVAALDRPGKKSAQGIAGTGVSRVAYVPKYRASTRMADIINATLGSAAGAAYVNTSTNTIFWRDQADAAKRTLAFVNRLDMPLPQANIRLNYYELRDSDLKDWGFDYLAWKNGPGVNLLNVGYNAGSIAINELLETVPYIASSSWGLGGLFTAPQVDMSFIRCLQQSGNASIVADSMISFVNTPVNSLADYMKLLQYQQANGKNAPYIYHTSMHPEYQNIARNILGRAFIGKSYYEDAEGNKFSDPPALEATIINPVICNEGNVTGGKGSVIFNYALHFKSVVERGNIGSELSNSAIFAGGATMNFGQERILAVYEKENDVEQTQGLPILCRIPVLKYLFSTVTTIKERTYVIVTAEVQQIHPGSSGAPGHGSVSTGIKRRIENPFRPEAETETK